ncbi:hypothetical protein ACGFZK_30855 [Streptomyces sp. NPDC048257]|uniref:hypothetical protein n=1 Tax=Streptomyces sp. NPDC048257 TaxID=3365526 RepID=UPI0037160F35
MNSRTKSALVTGALAATLVGALAPAANAAYSYNKNFSFNNEGVGAETGRWTAGSGSQAATQDHCATSAGNASNGVRVGYDFNRDISFLPDAYVAHLNWSCDNSIFWKSFSSSNSGSFYMAIASTPGWVFSDGRVNYNK